MSPSVASWASSTWVDSRVQTSVSLRGPGRCEVRVTSRPPWEASLRAYHVSGSTPRCGQMVAKHGGQRPFGEGQGLTELRVGGRYCSP